MKNALLIDYTGVRRTKVKGEVIIPISVEGLNLCGTFYVVDGLTLEILVSRGLMTITWSKCYEVNVNLK